MRKFILVLMLCLLAVERPAVGQSPSGFGIEVGGGTVAPVYIGADAVFLFPGRVFLDAGLGWVPPGYVNLINDIVVAAGGYEAETGELIKSSLRNSLAFRGGAGWRPFRDAGFEIRGGYTLLSLGGGVTPREVIEAATGEDTDAFGTDEIPLYSVLHNFSIETAWRWQVATQMSLRAGVGYIHTFETQSGFREDAPQRQDPEWRRVERAFDDYLRTVFRRYGRAPTLRLTVMFGI